MSHVRVRFAPSPTGKLHLGSAHTALYCWLYARRHGGKFILRIEDTDRERSTKENIEIILQGLQWLGLDWDEGPYYQSERIGLYKQAVGDCLRNGNAYRCTCTLEELEAKRQQARREKRKYVYDRACRERSLDADCGPHVVRLKMPVDGSTVIRDLVKGRIDFPNEELDDWIIARTDGTPTYNFCVVVDDADMKITHVLRGDDHISNTPKQIHVYAALGCSLPLFAHVPLIHGQDGQKLSKRHGATSLTEFKEMGFLPVAMRNYLARLGWAHGDDEIFTDEQLIKLFDIDGLSKSAAIFDMDKFYWTNATHMRRMDPAEVASLLLPFLVEKGYAAEQGPWLCGLVENFVERKRTLREIAESCSYFFVDAFDYEEKAATKFLCDTVLQPMVSLREELSHTEPFDEANLARAFESVCEEFSLKLGKLAQPVRVAVTGGTVSPGIFQVLELLGKQRTLARLDRAIAFIASAQPAQ